MINIKIGDYVRLLVTINNPIILYSKQHIRENILPVRSIIERVVGINRNANSIIIIPTDKKFVYWNIDDDHIDTHRVDQIHKGAGALYVFENCFWKVCSLCCKS